MADNALGGGVGVAGLGGRADPVGRAPIIPTGRPVFCRVLGVTDGGKGGTGTGCAMTKGEAGDLIEGEADRYDVTLESDSSSDCSPWAPGIAGGGRTRCSRMASPGDRDLDLECFGVDGRVEALTDVGDGRYSSS